jgi:ABC transporter
VLRLTGLDEVAGKQASKLSGGQTQRVRFAVALVSDPDLMVLDEPTAALDVQATHDFWDTMRQFAAQGRTIVFATHYLEEADEFADRIVLMAGGRIVADGSATQIKSVVDVRTIRATLPGVDVAQLQLLPGVRDADRRGRLDRAHLHQLGRCPARAAGSLRPGPGPRSARRWPGRGLPPAHRPARVDQPARPDRGAGAPVSGVTYLRYEVLRTFRNVRFFIISLVFPVVLYVVVVGGNRSVKYFAGSGLSFALYYMVGLVS